MRKTKKLLIEMSEGQFECLLKLAGVGGLSNFFRRALNTEACFQEAEVYRSKILIQWPDGRIHELVRG